MVKSKSIEEIEKESAVDLELRIDRTEVDSAETPRIFNKYNKQLRIVESELIRSELALKRLWRKKWYYYYGKADPEEYKKNPLKYKVMKSDLKMHIESDDDILKLTYTIEMLDMKKKFIEKIMKEISSRSFHIGNILRTMEFKKGDI